MMHDFADKMFSTKLETLSEKIEFATQTNILIFRLFFTFMSEQVPANQHHLFRHQLYSPAFKGL